MSDYRPKHEALARRRGGGFVAMCCCGWIGRERSDRRSASRDAREHEERAPVKELKRLGEAQRARELESTES